MPKANRYDSIELIPLALPYDNRDIIYSDNKRIGAGSDMYITNFKSLSVRPGFAQWAPELTGYVPARAWLYETLPIEGSVHSHMLLSVLNSSTGFYELWAKLISGYVSYTPFSRLTSFRDLNLSTQPHRITFSKGLAYVFSFPDDGSTEKLGTVVVDGSATDGSISIKP